MSRLTACSLLLAVLVPGCATTGGKIAGGAAAASTALAAATFHFDIFCNPGNPNGPLGACPSNAESAGFAAIAAGAALIGLILEIDARVDGSFAASPVAPAALSPVAAPMPAAPPLVTHMAAQDARAARFTQQAYFAARLGQCTAVEILGEQVRGLDPSYFQGVFLSDPTIAKCR